MLTKQFPFLDPARITSDLTDRLQQLAEDCALLTQFGTASPSQLRTAPLLDRYRPVITSPGVCLTGYVTGHPVLGSRVVVTSQLWWADPKGTWVRTLSRYYRLGTPAPAGDGFDDLPIVPGRSFNSWPEH